jgi:hypothetical protein
MSLYLCASVYQETPVPEKAGYFHAQWREGRYVGTFLAWTPLSDGWFGDGEVKFFLDGDTKFPTLAGTGTEDYFGGSYDFTRNCG